MPFVDVEVSSAGLRVRLQLTAMDERTHSFVSDDPSALTMTLASAIIRASEQREGA